jgi:5'-methylthioadenosine/S-adenosylhomocysteine nucleosidase
MYVKSILLVIAMKAEAEPILKALEIDQHGIQLEAPLPPIYYTTTWEGIEINLVVNGEDPVYKLDSFGTDAATLSTYLGIKKFSPNLVMSTGVAGGFKTKASIGDVYLSKDSVRYFDRRVSITKPNYQDYAIGFYPVADVTKMAAYLQLKTGVVVTGGSFENSLLDDRQIRNLDASVVEMEAAAVAKMSMLFKKQFVAAKAVVDFDDAIGFASQFDGNFEKATKNLASELKRIFTYLSNSPLAENEQ